MSPILKRVWPASVSVGAAAWFLCAALGIIDAPGGAVRVALLPPLWWLPLLVLAAGALLTVAVAGIDRVTATDGRGVRAADDDIAGAFVPLHVLWVLALPYLPWLPDAVPVLRVAAGHARWFIVVLILSLTAWALASTLRARRPTSTPARAPSRRATVVVGVLSFVASALVASRLVDTPLFPSGDEPHYLVIAQSLWRDGDLRIENNHSRGDYREYFGRDLAPHYVTRGTDGQIYSIHPIGLGVMLAPVYAAGGYLASVVLQMLMAAVAMALAWRWAARVTGSARGAWWAWAAVALGTPWLVNAFTLYPEVAAALLVTMALVAVTSWSSRAVKPWAWAVAGMSAALLPWFSTKYAPMSAALVAIALMRIWRDDDARPAVPWAAAAAVIVPWVVSLACWLTFFHMFWGTWSPSAPYGADDQTKLIHLRTGGPGLLFDQEYGLLAFTPAAILAFTGLAGMWRAGGRVRRTAFEIAIVAGALFATVGAFRIWWGGAAGPGRPLIGGLALLVCPIAWSIVHARTTAQQAGHRLLVFAGTVLAVTVTVAQEGLLMAAGRDGTSSLLQWWSPTWHLTEVVPSFIAHRPQLAVWFVLIWLCGAFAAGMWLIRPMRDRHAGIAATRAMLAAAVAILVASSTIEAIIPAAQQTAVDARIRSRSALFDRFDATRLPRAIRYDPWRIEKSRRLFEWLRLGTDVPLERLGGFAVPLALNARVSLPAGRYRLDVHAAPALAAPAAGTLGVQVGRLSDPLDSTPVTLVAGATWSHEFVLDVDANFVGVRASAELAPAIGAVWFTPIAIVDAHRRLPAPQVLAARRYGNATVYFHDEASWPEPTGFWTRGRGTARLSVAAPAGAPLRLRISGGPVPAHLTVDGGAGARVFELPAHGSGEFTLAASESPALLSVTSRDGFVPIELDSTQHDRRMLGARIEVIQ